MGHWLLPRPHPSPLTLQATTLRGSCMAIPPPILPMGKLRPIRSSHFQGPTPAGGRDGMTSWIPSPLLTPPTSPEPPWEGADLCLALLGPASAPAPPPHGHHGGLSPAFASDLQAPFSPLGDAAPPSHNPILMTLFLPSSLQKCQC